MRASFSGAAFCQASLVETQQAFLELHVAGVRVVRRRLRAGPLRQPDGSAVKQVLKGRRRVETDRFVALRSHYLFESQFTHAGPRGRAREGRRRGRGRPLPPQPPRPGPGGRDRSASSTRCCWPAASRISARRIAGRAGTVGEAWAAERPLLRALPAEPFDAAEAAAPRVDSKALVTVRQNRYSVPVALAGLRVPRASARARSRSATAAAWSRATSACTAGSAPAPSSITTSSCSRASPAAWSARWRSPRNASAAPGPAASTSSGPR